MKNSLTRRDLKPKGRLTRRSSEKGNVLIEFALIGPFLIAVLIGVVGVGFMLSRSVQVAQVTRDSAHMFFDGVDFSVVGNQNVVGRLGAGMGWTLATPDAVTGSTIDPNGNGVVILSRIIMVGANECAAGGYPNPVSCPNFGQLVVEQRVVIGNAALRTSSFGSPSGTLTNTATHPDGMFLPSEYCSDASVLVPAGSAPTNLNLAAGQFTYGVESFFTMPPLVRMIASDSYSYLLM